MKKWIGFSGALVCYLLGSIAGVFAFIDDRVNAWEMLFVIFYVAGLILTGIEWSKNRRFGKDRQKSRSVSSIDNSVQGAQGKPFKDCLS